LRPGPLPLGVRAPAVPGPAARALRAPTSSVRSRVPPDHAAVAIPRRCASRGTPQGEPAAAGAPGYGPPRERPGPPPLAERAIGAPAAGRRNPVPSPAIPARAAIGRAGG